MADIGQLYYQVEQVSADGQSISQKSSPEIETSGLELFATYNSAGELITPNIVTQYISIKGFVPSPSARFTRIGIQAPPGTKVVLNKTHSIMIGRTGIFELEADISSMYFLKTRQYTEDDDAMIRARRNGARHMKAAEEQRDLVLAAITTPEPTDNPGGADDDYNKQKSDYPYWRAYMKVEDDFHDVGYPNVEIEVLDDNDEVTTEPVMSYDKAKALYMTGINGIFRLPNPDDPSDPDNYVDIKNIVIDFLWTNS